jgi:hypothetical protein
MTNTFQPKQLLKLVVVTVTDKGEVENMRVTKVAAGTRAHKDIESKYWKEDSVPNFPDSSVRKEAGRIYLSTRIKVK